MKAIIEKRMRFKEIKEANTDDEISDMLHYAANCEKKGKCHFCHFYSGCAQIYPLSKIVVVDYSKDKSGYHGTIKILPCFGTVHAATFIALKQAIETAIEIYEHNCDLVHIDAIPFIMQKKDYKLKYIRHGN